MNKKKIYIITIFLITCGCIATYLFIQYNHKVEAQELAQRKQEEKIEKEKQNLSSAETAVEKAFETPSNEDIDIATKAIKKLSKKQKDDKLRLSNKLGILTDWLGLKNEILDAINSADKSKKVEDVKLAQKLLDKEIDDIFKEEKKTLQNRLNNIKEEMKKAKEEKAKQAQNVQEQVEQTQMVDSQSQVYNEVPQYSEQYQEPQNQQPAPTQAQSVSESNAGTAQTPNNPPSNQGSGSNGEKPSYSTNEAPGDPTSGTYNPDGTNNIDWYVY